MPSANRQNLNLVGIIGYPLDHSLSPLLHNTAFRSLRLPWHYQKFEVKPKELANCLAGVRAMGMRGLSVTIPHKEKVIRFLDRVTGAAAKIGAVNTIVNENGKLVGYNTDYLGFLSPLVRLLKPAKPLSVALLGAGGAARAVLFALFSHFRVWETLIFNRNQKRAAALARWAGRVARQEMQIHILRLLDASEEMRLADMDVIVNATPLGLYPKIKQMPVTSADVFRRGQIVYDLNYNPAETRLLREARRQKARTINGLEMLLGQGREAFRLWTGREMPVHQVRTSLTTHLNHHPGPHLADEE